MGRDRRSPARRLRPRTPETGAAAAPLDEALLARSRGAAARRSGRGRPRRFRRGGSPLRRARQAALDRRGLRRAAARARPCATPVDRPRHRPMSSAPSRISRPRPCARSCTRCRAICTQLVRRRIRGARSPGRSRTRRPRRPRSARRCSRASPRVRIAPATRPRPGRAGSDCGFDIRRAPRPCARPSGSTRSKRGPAVRSEAPRSGDSGAIACSPSCTTKRPSRPTIARSPADSRARSGRRRSRSGRTRSSACAAIPRP